MGKRYIRIIRFPHKTVEEVLGLTEDPVEMLTVDGADAVQALVMGYAVEQGIAQERQNYYVLWTVLGVARAYGVTGFVEFIGATAETHGWATEAMLFYLLQMCAYVFRVLGVRSVDMKAVVQSAMKSAEYYARPGKAQDPSISISMARAGSVRSEPRQRVSPSREPNVVTEVEPQPAPQQASAPASQTQTSPMSAQLFTTEWSLTTSRTTRSMADTHDPKFLGLEFHNAPEVQAELCRLLPYSYPWPGSDAPASLAPLKRMLGFIKAIATLSMAHTEISAIQKLINTEEAILSGKPESSMDGTIVSNIKRSREVGMRQRYLEALAVLRQGNSMASRLQFEGLLIRARIGYQEDGSGPEVFMSEAMGLSKMRIRDGPTGAIIGMDLLSNYFAFKNVAFSTDTAETTSSNNKRAKGNKKKENADNASGGGSLNSVVPTRLGTKIQ